MPSDANGAPVWGVFGGSFNPPHLGHVLLVHYLLGRGLVQRVVVLPCFAHAFGKDLCSFELRCRWLQNIFEGDARVQVSGIESSLSQFLGHAPRSLEVLEALQQRWPEVALRWVIGQDIMDSGETKRWYRWPEIESRYSPVVVPRASPSQPGPLPQVSSSELRRAWSDPSRAQWLGEQLPTPVRESWEESRGIWPVPHRRTLPRGGWVLGQGKAGRAMLEWLRDQGVAAHGFSARDILSRGEACVPAKLPCPELIWLAGRPADSAKLLAGLKGRITTSGEQILVCSSSGAYSADVLQLAPNAPKGALMGTLHPITSLTGEGHALDDAYFGWSGPSALGLRLSQWIGSERLLDLSHLGPQDRMAYHAACSLSSNYWGGVLNSALKLWASVGVEVPVGAASLIQLMRQSVHNLGSKGLPEGVSGPLVRGQEEQLREQQALWRGDDAALHAALVEAMRNALQK